MDDRTMGRSIQRGSFKQTQALCPNLQAEIRYVYISLFLSLNQEYSLGDIALCSVKYRIIIFCNYFNYQVIHTVSKN